MSDQDVQFTFDQLPKRVQESFNVMRSRLPAEFILRNPRATKLGWAMSIYTADGHHGGEVSVMAEPGELPYRAPPSKNGQG